MFGYRKDDYNWRYDSDELPEDVIRASAALENLQLDRKARNLTTSWRFVLTAQSNTKFSSIFHLLLAKNNSRIGVLETSSMVALMLQESQTHCMYAQLTIKKHLHIIADNKASISKIQV